MRAKILRQGFVVFRSGKNSPKSQILTPLCDEIEELGIGKVLSLNRDRTQSSSEHFGDDLTAVDIADNEVWMQVGGSQPLTCKIFGKKELQTFKDLRILASEKVFTIFSESGVREVATLDPETAIGKRDLAMQILRRQMFIRNQLDILVATSLVLQLFESVLKLLIFFVFEHDLKVRALEGLLLDSRFDAFFGEFVGLDLDLRRSGERGKVGGDIIFIWHFYDKTCDIPQSCLSSRKGV